MIEECVPQLLSRPLRGWMSSYVEVNHAAAIVGQYEKYVEDLESDGRNREKIDRDNLGDVVLEESAPGLGGGLRLRTVYLLTLVSPMPGVSGEASGAAGTTVVLHDAIPSAGITSGGPLGLKEALARSSGLTSKQLKQALLTLADAANGDPTVTSANIEQRRTMPWTGFRAPTNGGLRRSSWPLGFSRQPC